MHLRVAAFVCIFCKYHTELSFIVYLLLQNLKKTKVLANIAGQYTPGFFGGELQMGAQHRDRKCSGIGQGEEHEKSAAVSVNVYERVIEIEIFSEGGGGQDT